ncbi:nucleotidyltransferase [Alteromonas sp. 5E99-2]|uniref:nucleotidyltransferase domain-containing protein n=1 Tax=Alteromonas sp. 5E99-2 TaxID=2817683 RepID=UPI001F61FE30|nr:nucleotidyltransferase [Alteromonas sp. 5E99-2]
MSFNNLAVQSMSTSKWEDKFKNWSTGPGKTEQERCENAINMIKSAINASEKLKSKSIKVFLQGSYRNKVNVQADSDVDVGIVCSDVFFGDYPKGYNRDSFGYVAASYTFDDFKNDVEEALVEKFGEAAVTRGSKAFDIKANTYRVEADVAPFMEHRRFKADGSYITGVQQFSDDDKKVINWPEQHYENGVSKNALTSRRYKRTVRVLKKLTNEMAANGIEDAKGIPGFLCECLMWNVPNHYFSYTSFYDVLRNSIIYLHEELGKESSDEWGEVSELKYLFRPSQKWTKQQARKLLVAAWNYVGYE